MEPIEKALAKARQMRSERTERSTWPKNTPAEPPAEGIAHEYSETTVSPLDQHRIAEQRLIAYSHDHPASGAYRVLRTRVLQRMKQMGFSSLAVTSPSSSTGATTTAANLAISMALDVNQTVLLVDLNLRSPGMFRKFELKPTVGVDDYLRGQCTLKDCLVNPGMQRLVILPARAANPDAAEIMSSPRMAALAKELRTRYSDRIIIYDTPPLLASGDTLGFLPNVDAVLFVTRSGKTTKAELERSADLLQKFKVVGTLLNARS